MNKRIILTLLFSALFLTSINSALTYASFNGTPDVNSESVVTGPNPIWVPDNYTTIQEAIMHARAGDIVKVRAGTYNESIVIDKDNLMLIGENRENTIIDGGGAGFVVYVIAKSVTFSGFTIQNGRYGIWLWKSNNNNFTGNTALNNQYGIYLDGSNHNSLTGNTASRNNDGIYLESSSYNSLSGNTISSNNQYGILFYHSSNIVLSGNTVLNNTYGIYARDSDNNVLSGNIVLNNQYGIYLDFSSDNVLSGNTASSNSFGVYFWGSSDNVLSGNIVLNNQYGIYLRYSSNNILTYNDASSSKYGIYLWVSSDNAIFHSNFINNTEPVSSIGSVNSWDDGVEGNYWSDYGGVDLNRNGICDTSYAIDENNQDNCPLIAMLLQFNIATEGKYYNIDVVCNSTISEFRCLYDAYNRINAVSFRVNGTEGKGFCRIRIPHALIEPPYTVTLDYDPHLDFKIVYKNGTHTWLYFTYDHSEHEVIIMHVSSPNQFAFWSQWALLGLTLITVVLLSISIHYYRLFREQKKVVQAYERELGSFPASHSERARARFIKDVFERKEKLEKFKRKYGVKVYPANTLEELMEKLGVQKEKRKRKS